MTDLGVTNYKPALALMILHAILVIVWNIAGVWLISHGKSALGPTATLTGALLFAVLLVPYLGFAE
ncbi:MAG: hypothetical protein U9R60_04410 [Bacteroidota bacterium]|nr:hypothetical protein [Bacteroidota bacterium]